MMPGTRAGLMFCLVNGLGVGSVAGWCRVRGGFVWPVPRKSARGVCSDFGLDSQSV